MDLAVGYAEKAVIVFRRRIQGILPREIEFKEYYPAR